MSIKEYNALKLKKKEKPAKKVRERKLFATLQTHFFAGEMAIIFEWIGRDLSLNEWYSANHWSERDRDTRQWHEFFAKPFKKLAEIPKYEKYFITLKYNSNLDPSNCITMIKFYEDVLQSLGVIKNDNKNNSLGLSIVPCLDFKPLTYIITVTPDDRTKEKIM